MRRSRLVLAAFAWLLATGLGRPAASQAVPPLEPIGAIANAFQSHAIVALSEGDHGNLPGYHFRLSLIRDARINGVVNDIVVESGNALYQSTIDRYVDGSEVPFAELRKVWENTTQPFTTFDVPIYRDFFEAIRAVNATLPRGRRMRVLLGDPPIDWDRIRTKGDHDAAGKWLAERDSFPVDLIRREVLSRHRRALIVYGGMHLQRKQMNFNYSDADGFTIVAELERSHAVDHVFNIWTNTNRDLQTIQDTSGWPVPSLIMTASTPLGAEDFATYQPLDNRRVKRMDGRLVDVPKSEWATRRMADQFDAILYLGAPDSITFSELSPELCHDVTYLTMRMERFRLIGMPAGAERLQSFCATK